MSDFSKYRGYLEDFLGKKYVVPLPNLSIDLKRFVAPVKKSKDNVLRYHNYSVIQHAERRFPFLSAANIDGSLFQNLTRKEISPKGDRWYKDKRIKYTHQWGAELYKAPKSDFDRGHMTKREDVQWGLDLDQARTGAISTFYYTNAVPQRAELNQQLWRSLEDYILHEETVENRLRINLFTGPVLRDNDPEFVTPVRNHKIKIPSLFWKVIYYVKPGGDLRKVAFMVGQENLLIRNDIVFPPPVERGLEDPFEDFKLGDTYQVSTSFVEDITGMKFSDAHDPFMDDRPEKLIMEEVNMRSLEGDTKKVYIHGLKL